MSLLLLIQLLFNVVLFLFLKYKYDLTINSKLLQEKELTTEVTCEDLVSQSLDKHPFKQVILEIFIYITEEIEKATQEGKVIVSVDVDTTVVILFKDIFKELFNYYFLENNISLKISVYSSGRMEIKFLPYNNRVLHSFWISPHLKAVGN